MDRGIDQRLIANVFTKSDLGATEECQLSPNRGETDLASGVLHVAAGTLQLTVLTNPNGFRCIA